MQRIRGQCFPFAFGNGRRKQVQVEPRLAENCYHAAGVWRRGILGHPAKLLKGHVVFLAPINVVEELAKPISLSLRLFGNIFAGGILVGLIAMFPPYIMWAPNAIWKTFDLFVGAIQAFIFALLTILYFSQSMELEEEHD